MKTVKRKDGMVFESIHVLLLPGQHALIQNIAKQRGMNAFEIYQDAVMDYVREYSRSGSGQKKYTFKDDPPTPKNVRMVSEKKSKWKK